MPSDHKAISIWRRLCSAIWRPAWGKLLFVLLGRYMTIIFRKLDAMLLCRNKILIKKNARKVELEGKMIHLMNTMLSLLSILVLLFSPFFEPHFTPSTSFLLCASREIKWTVLFYDWQTSLKLYYWTVSYSDYMSSMWRNKEKLLVDRSQEGNTESSILPRSSTAKALTM